MSPAHTSPIPFQIPSRSENFIYKFGTSRNLTSSTHWRKKMRRSKVSCTSIPFSPVPRRRPTSLPFLISLLLILLACSSSDSTTFTITNMCSYTVWPGLLSGAGTPQLPTTGFALQPGESNAVSVPASWSGRVWGRTLCSQNPTTGLFTCLTGDCGSTTEECSGGGAAPPATLAEFTLDGAGGLDFYDVSLVDGYNLPVLVRPEGGTGAGNCTATGCAAELNNACPSKLKVVDGDGGGSVACRSACDAFGDPQYCCSGAYASPDTCKPSSYSEFFKNACPRAYSYAYDDGTSTFTCAGANYVITFCPPQTSTSVKSANGQNPEAVDVSTGYRHTSAYLIGGAVAVAVAVAFVVAAWQFRQLF